MTVRPQQDPEDWYTTADDRVKDAYDSINNDALPDTYFTRVVLSEKYSVRRGRRTRIYTTRTIEQLIARRCLTFAEEIPAGTTEDDEHGLLREQYQNYLKTLHKNEAKRKEQRKNANTAKNLHYLMVGLAKA